MATTQITARDTILAAFLHDGVAQFLDLHQHTVAWELSSSVAIGIKPSSERFQPYSCGLHG